MYHAGIGTFLQRDPLPQEGESWVGYSHEWVAKNLYQYVNGNPTNWVDPSGLVCRPADPPASVIPPEDPYFPTATWKPQPARGYPLTFQNRARHTFSGVKCSYAPPTGGTYQCCTMDIEISAKAYRYFRFTGNTFVGHRGQPIGVSNEPYDFFSIVVFTICRTNIKCDGKTMPDSVETFVSEPLQKDARGVFIRQFTKGDIETTANSFQPTNSCTFAEDAAVLIQQNTIPGELLR